jgi:hypothetical protein
MVATAAVSEGVAGAEVSVAAAAAAAIAGEEEVACRRLLEMRPSQDEPLPSVGGVGHVALTMPDEKIFRSRKRWRRKVQRVVF